MGVGARGLGTVDVANTDDFTMAGDFTIMAGRGKEDFTMTGAFTIILGRGTPCCTADGRRGTCCSAFRTAGCTGGIGGAGGTMDAVGG